MKEWWTAAEIAARALPGLPATKAGVRKLALREGWLAKRGGDGAPLYRATTSGKIEFHAAVLPDAARVALISEQIAPPKKTAAPLPSVTSGEVRDARLAILQLHARFAADRGTTPRASDDAFAAAWSAGNVPADDWVRAAVKKVSARTLRRWRETAAHDKERLAGRQGSKRESIIEALNEGAVAEAIAGVLVHRPNMSATSVRAFVRGAFKDTFEIMSADGELVPVALPKERAFRDYMAAWKERNKLPLIAMTDPDRFKSSYRVSGLTRYAGLERPNEVWEIDASPADVMCTDGRHQVYVLVDIWTRRMIVFVTRTPRGEAVMLLVRKAILAFGVPETIKTDNGSDFTSHWVQRAFASLGIARDLCAPFSPEQKGTVERAIGTLQRGLMPMLPGFVGHSVADRKVIEARSSFAKRLGQSDDKTFGIAISSAELQGYADRWADAEYGRAPHSSLPERMSPFERAQSYKGSVKRITDVRALDMLLAPVADRGGVRTYGKQGLKIDNGWFITSSLMPGDKVLVRHDAQDMGRVYCFSHDGERFLAEAVCPERIGASRAAAVAQARAEQNRIMSEGKAELRRAARAIRPRDMAEKGLAQAEADARGVVAFPKPSTPHTTPQIEAAAEAAMPRAERVAREAAKPLTGKAAAEHARMLEEFKAGTFGKPKPQQQAGAIVPMRQTAEQRFRQALGIEQALERGEDVPPADALWLMKYRETGEYKGHRAIHDQFGPGVRTG